MTDSIAIVPTDPGDLSVGLLDRLISDAVPGAGLASFAITEAHAWGGGDASSAGRICIDAAYKPGSPADLPRSLVLKVARCRSHDPRTPDPISGAGGTLYRNELNIYRHLKPAGFVEAPRFLGGVYDADANALLLVIEDLRLKGATFPHVDVPTSMRRMMSLLDQLAKLHALFWNKADAAWMEAHTAGAIHSQFSSPHVLPPHVERELAAEQFKREMVERLGTDPATLFRQVHAVQAHQARLPQTLCHGDTHIGNTYALPDDSGGLLDWQLASRGFCVQDVSYLITTGLSIAERRASEHELMAYYRDRLVLHGVADAPTPEELWLEYRRAMVWGVYIGWLITPVANYGWQKTVMAHLRTMTAYEDHETGSLIASMM